MADPESARRIPVAAPALVGREREYVLDAIDSSWISSSGQYIERFEAAFAEVAGCEHAVACCNGTVALHLALAALGVGPGDEVIVPTLTYVATANAVVYCGATPVLVDSEPATWNLDPERVAEAITERTRAIVVVHLYGHPADMDPIRALADSHGLAIVEDAAEAHGATYKGRPAGSLGDVATFSFYGNKIITTGEGGMLTTADRDLALHIRQLRGQGQDLERRYWFPMVGFNYRMTNVAAAIGLGQVERFDWHLGRRREIAEAYRARLAGVPGLRFSPEADWAESAYWISCVVLGDEVAIGRDEMMAALDARGIETRPFFIPMHALPMYESAAARGTFPVAGDLAARGINLPSGAGLTDDDVERVAAAVVELAATAG
jgi:perosamine synthetase